MDKPGPPRPKATGEKLQASLDDEPTAVALPESAAAATRPSSPDGSDLEVTVADPVNDLLATTEMPTVREGFAAPEEAEEEEDPNKAYFAPQAIPTPAVPDNDDSRRVVLNLPDKAAVLPVSPQDAERARRRAPTVKIPRATLAARGALPAASAAPEVALPPPPPPAPRAPVLATPAEDPPEEVKPESPLLSLPVHPRESSSERKAEPPPTARHVSERPQNRSRMPLVALAALCIGGGVFAVYSLGGSRDATKVSDATAPVAAQPQAEKSPAAAPPPVATTPVEKPVAVTPPEETAAPPITLTADPAPPATTQALAGTTPPKPTPAAGPSPTTPRPANPAPAAAPPRPPTAAPPKPPMKPGDYTPPTI